MTVETIVEQPKSVLLVEDEPGFATLVKLALGGGCKLGFRVHHVDRLSAARELLAWGNIDVVLTDLSLPDSNGAHTFETLHSAAPGVPIVVLTNSDEEECDPALLNSGARDFLRKDDVESKLLTRSLQYAIERQRSEILSSLNSQLEQTKLSLVATVAELKTANTELAQFTYFASHDLQEPIRKISYFCRELHQNAGGALNERAQLDLQYICDAARRMQALVESFLTLSYAGQKAFVAQTVDLERCVSDVLKNLQGRIEDAGAAITRDPLPVVKGDATLLRQLYENLLTNALKFTADVPLEIHLTACAREDQWLLGVRDNGIGIEPDFAQTIFTPFQRLHSRDRYEGAGIGLAICQKVVSRLGGTIWVESVFGQGSHFQFLLPGSCPTHRSAPCESPAEVAPAC